jgi:acyl dehydratase
MLSTLTKAELELADGRELPPSAWRLVDQQQVDLFAAATGDDQWIHVDPVRAAAGPFGGTVAHGYLTLSLIPVLLGEVLSVGDSAMGVNYGIEKVRFPSPVRVGSRVRLRAVLGGGEPRGGGVLYRVSVTIEVEGSDKPALVGEVLFLAA